MRGGGCQFGKNGNGAGEDEHKWAQVFGKTMRAGQLVGAQDPLGEPLSGQRPHGIAQKARRHQARPDDGGAQRKAKYRPGEGIGDAIGYGQKHIKRERGDDQRGDLRGAVLRGRHPV